LNQQINDIKDKSYRRFSSTAVLQRSGFSA